MKAQCEKCREFVELSFRVQSAGIEASCPACHASYFVAESGVQKRVAPSPPQGETCPKCGLTREGRESCRRCGLVFARWAGPDAEQANAERAAAELLWAACAAKWDDAAVHDAFVAHCHRHGMIPFAAGKYHAARDERGSAAEPIADRRLLQIRTLAEAAMAAAATEKPGRGPGYRRTLVVLGVAVLLLLVALAWLFGFGATQKRERGGEQPQVPTLPKRQR